MMIIGKVLGVKKMNKFSNELDRIDFVTDMMFSTDFLKCISDCVFSEKASMMTVKEFYDCWKFERGAENGLKNAIITNDSNSEKLRYRYVVRRIRNALGHGNIAINIPDDLQSKDELFSKASIVFEDINIKGDDKFKVDITLEDLTIFIRKLHEIAYKVAKTQKKEYETL